MKCINHPMADAVGICINCGKPVCETCKVESAGETYCKKCISEKVNSKEKKQKSPVIAAILSFFIGGLGQIYNGQAGKGLLIFFTSWLIIPWIYGIVDACLTADKINKGVIVIPSRPGCVIAAIVVMVIIPVFVLIIALMAAIAIPSFIVAKNTAEAKTCVYHLRNIDTAKQIYAEKYGLSIGSTISAEDTNGIDDGDGIPDVLEVYLDTTPKCPKGGMYSVGKVGGNPSCSTGDNGTSIPSDDHIIHNIIH